MNQRIDIGEVKTQWLNKRALVLISIFAHAANEQEGAVVDLRADNVLRQISAIVKRSGNTELDKIYQRIKREIKISLSPENATEEAIKAVSEASVYDHKDDPRSPVNAV